MEQTDKSIRHTDQITQTPQTTGTRTEETESAQVRTLITREDHVDYYLSEGNRLLRSGLPLGLSPSVYIAAYPPLSAFLHQQGDTLAERGVVSAEIEAGQVLIERLRGALPEGLRRQDPGGAADRPEDALEGAAGKLAQVRDTVRRIARGPDGAADRAEFGLDQAVEADSAASVLRGIELFLSGARKLPERLRAFRLIQADLLELEEHRDRLRDLPPAEGTPARKQALPAPALRLLAAAEAYFSSIAAAISAAFPAGDPRRLSGLKLIPRTRERREHRSVRPLPRLWRASLPTTDE